MLMQPNRAMGARRLVAVTIATTVIAMLVAVVGVVALTTRTAQGSGGGGGCTSPTVCTTRLHNAFADFGSVSPDGCVFTDGTIQAFESLTSPGHASTTTAIISIVKFDQCAGTFVEGVSNIDPATQTPDFTGTLHFSTLLNTATVTGSAPMFDGAGNLLFTTNVQISWQAFGPSTTFIDSMHVRGPGIMVNSHSNSSTREAEASGTMTDELGANVASPPTLNAVVQEATGGTVQIVKT